MRGLASPIVVSAVCAVSLSAVGHAQRVGAVDPKSDARNRTLDKITTYEEMNDCQMRPNLEAAKALLAATTIEDARRQADRFKWKTCALKGPNGDFMKVQPNNPKLDELRWMSAEYFIVHDAASVAALQPLPRKRAYDRSWFRASSRDDSIDEMATCIADTNPAGIAALNRTQVGSKDEQATLSGLNADFVACLRAGVTLKGERKAIRGALVEALYQRTQPWPLGEAEKAGATH